MALAVVVITQITLWVGSAYAVPYTFDINNLGWQQSTVGYNGGNYEKMYPNTGAYWTGEYGVGSPDGSVYQTSNGSLWENRPYWMGMKGITAADTLGDLTGRSLQASVRSTANWTGRVGTNTVYARWTIAIEYSNGTSNMWVSKAQYSINLNGNEWGSGSDEDWLLKSIGLIENNFFKWPNSQAVGSFADVLKNYTSFGLAILPTASGDDNLNNFNGNTGTWGTSSTLLHYGATAKEENATWGVDNYKAVPEPATMFLLGLGLVGLISVRKKRN